MAFAKQPTKFETRLAPSALRAPPPNPHTGLYTTLNRPPADLGEAGWVDAELGVYHFNARFYSELAGMFAGIKIHMITLASLRNRLRAGVTLLQPVTKD